jgi:hypothetical protein
MPMALAVQPSTPIRLVNYHLASSRAQHSLQSHVFVGIAVVAQKGSNIKT